MKTERERLMLCFVLECLYKRNLITNEEYRNLVARIVKEEMDESLYL